MPQVSVEYRREKELLLKGMEDDWNDVSADMKELAKYIIPQRYLALDEGKQPRNKTRNKYILDGHATMAARTLAAGMLSGATNPTHRWLKLSVEGADNVTQRWLDHVVDTLLKLMGRSNMYNALSTLYLDLGVFGTSPMLIYEDPQTLVRFYNLPAGEYRLMKDEREQISYLGRKFKMTSDQLVNRFGIENCSTQVQQDYSLTNRNKFTEHDVYHLIEPNVPATLPAHFAYRECYWEPGGQSDMFLEINGFYEKPFVAGRWETVGNNTYGVSPGQDALPDIISLQHLVSKKAKGLDKQVSPPLVADQSLKNQPTALMPNGITYVPSAAGVGAKPVYQIALPYNELKQDKDEIKHSISRFFFADLFRAILDLQTVRSATEVAEAVGEKLVLLGPVIGRLEDEVLSDMVSRVFGIAARAGMFPEPPGPVGQLGIEYDSILSNAQKAAGIGNIERFSAHIGQIVPISPDTMAAVNFDELLRELAGRLSIPAAVLRSRQEVEAIKAQQQAQQEALAQAQISAELTQAAAGLQGAA